MTVPLPAAAVAGSMARATAATMSAISGLIRTASFPFDTQTSQPSQAAAPPATGTRRAAPHRLPGAHEAAGQRVLQCAKRRREDAMFLEARPDSSCLRSSTLLDAPFAVDIEADSQDPAESDQERAAGTPSRVSLHSTRGTQRAPV